MQKDNPPSTGALSWGFVDQAVTGVASGGHRGVEVRHAIAEVMDAGASTGQEFRYGARRIARGEQLDLALSSGEHRDRGAIGRFKRPWSEAQHIPVEHQRLVEVLHGDADMGEASSIDGGHEPSK